MAGATLCVLVALEVGGVVVRVPESHLIVLTAEV